MKGELLGGRGARSPLLLLILQASTGVELEEDNVAVGNNVFTSLLSVLSSGLNEGNKEETTLKRIHILRTAENPASLLLSEMHKTMEAIWQGLNT